MKYFIDTEFIEGFKTPLFGKRKHFIDLISIGIVAEDGREYYAISKEFKWKDVNEWAQKNAIFTILEQEVEKYNNDAMRKGMHSATLGLGIGAITVIQKFVGKTNAQIAQEIMRFVIRENIFEETAKKLGITNYTELGKEMKPEFWGYYADYDWVLFCSLFGRMVDLPRGFPMYCKDLKQMMDEHELTKEWEQRVCPDPEGGRNSLVGAMRNRMLYEYIKNEIIK